MISSVLVANRGEIARRVFASCRDLGLGTVAVFSDADAALPHVREADRAVRLPGVSATDTYRRPDLLIDAAQRSGADAIHPGYGFLSENPAFARAVAAADLTWIGPTPAAMATMGSKANAKQVMAATGAPVLPLLNPEKLTAQDLPVVLKAAAGGGGRALRVVHDLADLPDQLRSVRAEAAGAFNDTTVICEPYVHGYHVEVQILADQHGTVWTLGARDCSLQRRHQKVIEETPSPHLDPELGHQLATWSAAAARAVGYTGAGTLEFLITPEGHPWFLEMNTRLQVEHPVTECVYRLDLVAWQLRIATGTPLPPTPPQPDGHAIEARLYAEDPAAGWLPATGPLHRLHFPEPTSHFTPPQRYGLRLDSGVSDHSHISTDYDPLLAKIIAWAPDRATATRRLATALNHAQLHGITTNRDLLVRALRHHAFQHATATTDFLQPAPPELTDPLCSPRHEPLTALAAALADSAHQHASQPTSWAALPTGWRNLPSQPQHRAYQGPHGRLDVTYHPTPGPTGPAPDHPEVQLAEPATPDRVVLEIDHVLLPFAIARYPGLVCVDSPLGPLTLRPLERLPAPHPATQDQNEPGALLAPMPGVIVEHRASIGDPVETGATLLTLEAMKTLHQVHAPHPGTLRALPVPVGSQVTTGQTLAVIDPPPVPHHHN